MKWQIPIGTLAALLILAGAARAATIEGILNPEETRTVTERVQKIRQLKFEHRVPFSYLTVNQAQARLRAELERYATPAEFKLAAREGEMIGLYPQGVDLERENLTMMKSQLAGFYDSHDKDLVIIERPIPTPRGINPRILEFVLKLQTAGVLAHELTHALQDQHFGLDAMLSKVRHNSDREMALRAIVEGDATLSGFCTVVGRANSQTVDYFLSNIQDVSSIFLGSVAGQTEEMREMLIFPYAQGARFVARAYDRHGWAGVDALFHKPPQSTQQILHPSLYFDHPTPPIPVIVDGYSKVLAGWKNVDDDTYGQLVLKVIIERWMGGGTPYVQAAEGWAGDRCVALRKGKDLSLIWIVDFRSKGQAQNFADLYPTILSKALPKLTARYVQQNGSAVMVLLGDGAIRFHDLAPAVWKASTVGGKHLPAAVSN